jgi:S-adenosylmethionine:tRNA ribosyltransferase-isomerase
MRRSDVTRMESDTLAKRAAGESAPLPRVEDGLTRSDLSFTRPAANQATGPAERRGLQRDGVRLLVTTSSGHDHVTFRDLPHFLPPGTVLVVNTSATVAASLPASGTPGEFVVNLCTSYGRGVWLAEPRWSFAQPGPLPLSPGDSLSLANLPARTITPFEGQPRLWFIQIEGDVERAMATYGSPIRYGYVEPPYPTLTDYQTIFSRHGGSVEMPSAGRPFTARVLASLAEREVQLVPIVLHTGVSSLEVETDIVEAHPLYPEPFHVPATTAKAINAARAEGRPVVAVGTTVVRALESSWDGQRVRPSTGFTRVMVHPGRPVRSVDGLVTGLHDPEASHLAMLFALAPPDQIRDAYAEAIREGYLWHEFGDSHLILPRAA